MKLTIFNAYFDKYRYIVIINYNLRLRDDNINFF